MNNLNWLKFSLLLILFVSITIQAQSYRKRWVIISDVDNRITYIDTTSITQSGDQISVWSLTKYRTPINIHPFPQKIARVQSNYLFNTVENKYAIIGAIYFDRMGKIVGQSNNPNVGVNKALFINNIENGSIHQVLLTQSIVYLSTGKLTVNVKENNREIIQKRQPSEAQILNESPKLKEKTYVTPDESDSIKYSVGVDLQNEIIISDQQSAVSKELKENLIENNAVSIKSNDDKSVSNSGQVLVPTKPQENNPKKEEEVKKTNPPVKKSIPKGPVSDVNYNKDNESIIEGNIWSDGKYFCLQLSSWTSNAKAQNEVNRYKNLGFNAFVEKAFVAQRNRTYYRVRVGYYYTLAEAKEAQSKIN